MTEQMGRFKHQSMQDSQSIVRYLTALKDGFENGALVFSTNGKRLVLKPQGLVNLEVEAKRKGEGIKLSLKFRWTEEEPATEEGGQPLLIETYKSK
ncbi:MAG: amphi-Trp domain-containing protein [Desulfarculaceae bacterium]|nr:amphi-Trp domain-containing protein [Desulfarculaceae bacterium]MCF8071539.1 amphi-Trp domain-containing protein [Desulfarculaceae bacterium]MCF8102354.1 amphi-Trp domain-containing protein [Desulfarculaceae bacterium]MCF8114818.1 amphi-Trp domain-containing protein [Desulfarculaceae bacterium]